MTTTLIGQVLATAGVRTQTDETNLDISLDGITCPTRLPLRHEHDNEIGRVVHLERSTTTLWAVAEITDQVWSDLTDGPYWFSLSGNGRGPTDHALHRSDTFRLDEISVTRQPAAIVTPIVTIAGQLRADGLPHGTSDHHRSILGRAVKRRGQHLEVVDERLADRHPAAGGRLPAAPILTVQASTRVDDRGRRWQRRTGLGQVVALDGRPLR